MPSNKQKPRNSFYYYMKELQEKAAKEGKNYTMNEMSAIAGPQWKRLSLSERQKYEVMAKTHKSEFQQRDRLAADGSSIKQNEAIRKKLQEQENRMRQGISDFLNRQRLSKEEFIAMNATTKLYFVSFNVVCHVRENDVFIPNEISLVEYTIKDGIRDEYHTLIDPGEIPKGYTGEAMRHSANTHKIPVPNREMGESNYSKIWQDIMDFISSPVNESELPPLFCPKSDIPQNSGSLKWLAEMTGTSEDIIKVWDGDYLHMELRAGAGQPAVSYNAAAEELKQTGFDYSSTLKCAFHEEIDNLYCTVAKVKRVCYVTSDVMCKLFDLPVTSRHLPERSGADKPYEVFRPLGDSPSLTSERSDVGRGKSRTSSFDSRSESATSNRVPPRHYARKNPETEESVCAGSTPAVSAYDANSSDEFHSDSEEEYVASSPENWNSPRMQSRTSETDSLVLRQPVSSSIALNLARATSAPAVAPGKGIGRGQRKT